tara:strand:- start:5870 stop:6265 length:396 start_codon:yes stop_codon:yes gene_type:complete
MNRTLNKTETRWVKFIDRNPEYAPYLWDAWQKIIDGVAFEDVKAHFITNVTDDTGIAGAISFFARKIQGRPMSTIDELKIFLDQIKEDRRIAREEAKKQPRKFVPRDYGSGTYIDDDGNEVHWVGRKEKFN